MLDEARLGEQQAVSRLGELVYDQLRVLAHSNLRGESAENTLRTTALVNEAFVRILGQPKDFESRQKFFAFAAKIMRHVLVDYARERKAQKRGGNVQHIGLDSVLDGLGKKELDLMALNEALQELESLEPRLARIVELKFFAGLTANEIAHELGVSPPTVNREWRLARAWLHRTLQGGS